LYTAVWGRERPYGDAVPEDHPLVATADAARALGISRRTLSRYALAGLVRPALVLPSGRYRWDVDDLRRQLAALPREPPED
jgi:SLT domain-containing protein